MKSVLDFRSAIWSVAFRPFFLFSSFHAIFAVLVWILILFSVIPSPFLAGGIQIHSYEMVFGFGRGAIIGFLFTAGQNWTKKFLAKEGYLALLFGLWFFGRFGFLSNQYLSYFALLRICIVICWSFSILHLPYLQKVRNITALLWLLTFYYSYFIY